MEFTELHIGNLRIMEPMAVFTDFIISALCCKIFLYFKKNNSEKGHIYLWSYFFIFMGISTFLGGIVHAAKGYLSFDGYMSLWLAMQMISGFSVYFAQSATIHSEFNGSRVLNRTILAQLVLFIILTLLVKNFLIVTVNIALGFMSILICFFRAYLKGEKNKGVVSVGILVSFLPAIVHLSKFSINKWMNYIDISHLLIALSLYIIFKGLKHPVETEEVEATLLQEELTLAENN